MSIERCTNFDGRYHLPGLDCERLKGWKGALALSQSRSSTGAFVFSYVQSMLGKRGQGEPASRRLRFLRCSISHVVMVASADMLLGIEQRPGGGV